VVTESMVCGALAAGTLRPLLLAHRRGGCVRRVNQQTQRWADRESAQAQASGPRGFGGSMMSRVTRGESSDSSGARVAEGVVGTWTMAAPEDRFRNRPEGGAIRGDLNLPETRGLNRRGGSERVVESGAAGLGARGFARWPERDGVRRRTGGTVSADTFGFGTGRPSPGRRPRSREPRANVGARSGPASSSRVSAFGVVDGQRRSPDGG